MTSLVSSDRSGAVVRSPRPRICGASEENGEKHLRKVPATPEMQKGAARGHVAEAFRDLLVRRRDGTDRRRFTIQLTRALVSRLSRS